MERLRGRFAPVGRLGDNRPSCATKHRGPESSTRLENPRAAQDIIMAEPRPIAGPCAELNARKDKASRYHFFRRRELKPDLRAAVGRRQALVSEPRGARPSRVG